MDSNRIFDKTYNSDEFRNWIKKLTPLNNGLGWAVGEEIGKELLDLGCKEGEGFTINKFINL
ncbi:MAG TPA: hypothetical protein VGB37_10735 [Candidatus Lokiarchaeia archaeon]